MAITGYISKYSGQQIEDKLDEVKTLEDAIGACEGSIDELEEAIQSVSTKADNALAKADEAKTVAASADGKAVTAQSLATEAKTLAQSAKDAAEEVKKICVGNGGVSVGIYFDKDGQKSTDFHLPAGTYKFYLDYEDVVMYLMLWLNNAGRQTIATLNSNFAIGGVLEREFTIEEEVSFATINTTSTFKAAGTITAKFLDLNSLEGRIYQLEYKLN